MQVNISTTSKIIKGFSWIASGTVVEALLKIIVLAVMARLISPHDFGVANAAMIVIGFSQLFTNMGVGPAIVQKKTLTTEHIKTGFTATLILGFVFAGCLFYCSKWISAFFVMDELTLILQVISFTFIIESLSVISQSLLQRDFQFKTISIVSSISYFFGFGVVGIICAYKGLGVWALIVASIVQTVIKTFLFLIYQKHKISLYFDKKAFKELFYFGGGFTLARIGNYLAGQGDNIIIGRYLGSYALGIYGRAYQFLVMPVTLLGTSLDKVLFPVMSQIQDDTTRLKEMYNKSVYLFSLTTIPLTVYLIVLSPEFIDIVLGNSWKDVVFPFQILAVGLYFRLTYRICDSLARAIGIVYKRAWIQFIYAAFVIVGAFIGRRWGIEGVAVAVSMAIFINYILLTILSINSVKNNWKDYLLLHKHGFFVAIIIFPVIQFITVYLRRLEMSSISIIAINTCICLLILLTLYYLFSKYIKTPNEKWLYDSIKKITHK
jgi:PST family polysaccharide transporter